ncbi:MAG: hypothetical protein J0G29_05355 [Alphaproteobacteria bacterium]|nr:hypothetical protein [Alphaproteobacteria bacterium]OJV47815.1 MAG: hypothetical protein BGO28_05780 [Alphaproteobacteria bacterium 43-37]
MNLIKLLKVSTSVALVCLITAPTNASSEEKSLLPELITIQTNLAQRVGANTQSINGLDERVRTLQIDMKGGFSELRNETRTQFADFRHEMNSRFETIDKRFETIDKRFETIDKRFETIDKRFEAMGKEMNSRFEAVDKRFEAMGKEMNSRFEAMDKRFDTIIEILNSTLVNHGKRIEKLEEHWTIGLQDRILNWGTVLTLGGVAASIKAAATWALPTPVQNCLILLDGVALGTVSWDIVGPAFPQFLVKPAELTTFAFNVGASFYMMEYRAAIADQLTLPKIGAAAAVMTSVAAALGNWDKLTGYLSRLTSWRSEPTAKASKA